MSTQRWEMVSGFAFAVTGLGVLVLLFRAWEALLDRIFGHPGRG